MILYNLKLLELKIRICQGNRERKISLKRKFGAEQFMLVLHLLGYEYEQASYRCSAWMRLAYCTDDHFLQKGKYRF
jgi:hypothetical protein